ncbi:xanthine dehydrogenase family protein molybdopterin-binding subunit [Halovulum sp. GXIMD14793]
MGRVGTIARRTFLVGSAAIAGGVAFGVYRAHATLPNPLKDQLAKGEATFNPWVLVDSDKVTVIATHADKGQGVWTAQAALICEELDIDLDQVEVSFGIPAAAYYNTAMAAEMVPFATYDDGRLARSMRSFASGAIKAIFPIMGTGGSSAMPDSFDKLRQAGAVARETLKAAAARVKGVEVSQLKTAKGAVLLPDGSKIKYTELAAAASGMEPVTEVTLRDPKDWRLLGKPFNRLDMAGKVTGTLEYGIDVQKDDMVFAAVKVNPRQGGVMNGYDPSAAQDMQGVQKIVEVTNGVAVIATNTWYAFQALEAIDFDWGPAPYPAEQAGHWQALSDAFTEDKLNAAPRNEGDVEAAEGQLIEAEYRSPYVAHAPLEPLNATILVTDDRVDIWTGHQVQMMVESIVAGITGHDTDAVHLHNMFIGGSFGHRLEFEHIKQAAEIAMQMKGTPVKLTYSREEDFAHDFPRQITMGRGKAKVADGKVVSVDLQLAAPSVMASQMSRMGINVAMADSQLHAGAWDQPYFDLPNLRVRSYNAGDLAPVSSWRSVGAAPNGFIFDSLLDEAIHAAGADPLEERLRLMGHDVSRKVLETVGEMSSWGSTLAPGKAHGVGYVMSFGVPTAEVVEITNTDAGIRIDKVWVACDVGRVVDPRNFENLVQGGVVFGLGHAINSEITYSDGMADQANYYDAEGMRLYQCPEIFVKGLENADKIRGIGEPPVPPAAPALANAIFAATGQRLREMPFGKFIDFV